MNLIQLLLICIFLQSSSSSSSSDSSNDRKKEFKKVKKSLKKFTKVTACLVKKKLMSVENLHEFRSFVTEAMEGFKDETKSSKKKKSTTTKVALEDRSNCHLYEKMQQVQMPILDEGNMKRFHESFMKYHPMMLMFKEKFGHLKIPGEDPENERPGLYSWLKNTRAVMSKYKKEGTGRFCEEPKYYELLRDAGVTVCSSNHS
jgi:hypothetical protein